MGLSGKRFFRKQIAAKKIKKAAVHPASTARPLRALLSKAQARLTATQEPDRYRCYLPVLAGLAAGPLRRAQTFIAPKSEPGQKTNSLGREFSPTGAGCGYRAPLAPRLARLP